MTGLSPDNTVNAKSIFNPATGYIQRGGFDWTCNPYLGCTFGCTYCYAAFLPQNPRPRDEWGRWFRAKTNAVELARKQARKLAGKAVYISTVTDPYMPIERSLELTRGILQELLPHQPRLVIQTRGPLVVRDIDLFRQFCSVRINISIPTDSEEVRLAFEPKAPPLEKRWEAAQQIRDSGVPTGICVTPMLPLDDADAFLARLLDFRPDVLVTQEFHDSCGGFGADTGDRARQLARQRDWTLDDYKKCVTKLREKMHVYEGEGGFFPPPAAPPEETKPAPGSLF